METKTDNDYVTKTALKNEFGFTDTMITSLMPKPDLTKPNPYYRSAAPMQLWKREVVESIIESPAYRTAKQEADNHRKSARKAIATKKKSTMEAIKQAEKTIEIEQTERDRLVRLTLANQRLWNIETKGEYYPLDDVDKATLDRWMVNYVRHELSNYDYLLHVLHKKVGKRDAYEHLFETLQMKIIELYPYLKEECLEQISKKKDHIVYISGRAYVLG